MSCCKDVRCRSRRKMSGPPLVSACYSVPDSERFLRACAQFKLPSGESLAEASSKRILAVVFLRHFGCTFTRQILRGLETLEHQATARQAELVLVHMLKVGGETPYLSAHHGVSRIADPNCELYRAFGLGRGGFLQLLGPRVWILGAMSIFKGCGVGRIAGDGLQMPGAFLLHQEKIIAGQPAQSASDLPNLPALFSSIPSASLTSTIAVEP